MSAPPTSFESQWKLARNLVLSANKQAAWGGTLADANMTQRQRFDGGAVLELTTGRRSDKEYSGKGSSFATNGQITSYDTKFNGFKAELSDWLSGYLMAFTMGKDVVTGSAAPYTHTFTFDESTRTAPGTTVYLEDTAAVKYKCPDMAINDVTLTIDAIGAIMAEATMMGTGRQVMGAMTTLPVLPAETYLLGSDCTFSLGPVGAAVATLGRFMTATLKLDNQLIVHRAPGTGLYASFIRRGDPKFSLSATVAAMSTDDIYTLYENNTPSTLILATNSGPAAQMIITIPQVNLKTTKLGFDGDMTIWQIEADETTCYQAAGVPPITIQVLNSVAAYLAPA